MIEFYNPFSRKYLILTQNSADLRRICESLRPRCHPDGTREFTMRVLRKSAESA